MANSETGHAKNVANFQTLISNCTSFGVIYNPSNRILTIENLKLFHIEAKGNLNKVSRTKSEHDDIEGKRQTLFGSYRTISTKIMGALLSSGAPQTVINDARTISRKMQGRRAPGTKIELNEDGTKKSRNSISQQSFDMRIEHLDKMIELLSFERKYDPNEPHLTIEGLRAYHDELDTINEQVKDAYGPYSNAMNARNRKLYAPEIGLVAIANSVKNYAKSIYKTNTPEYKSISKLPFKTLVDIE